MEAYEMKKESCEKAEQLSKEIIEMCVEKKVTLQELELLKTVLPIVIDQKISEAMYVTKLL